jgi:hypothetical protein
MQTDNNLSEAKRRLLERYLQQGSAESAPATIPTRPRDQTAPLSLSQEQLWLRETNIPGIPPLYNECVTIRMAGRLDVRVLESSLLEVIRRHEIWRTSYEVRDGEPVQVVHTPPSEVSLPVFDLSNRSVAAREAESRHEAESLVRDSFDLQAGPLLRFKLVKIGDFEYQLLLCAHLSIVDGVSVYQVFPTELAALYVALSSGKRSPLPALPIQFGDYACWQGCPAQARERINQLQYWKKQLAGPPPMMEWPNCLARRSRRPFAGAIQRFTLSQNAGSALQHLTQREGVTQFTSLTTAFAALLKYYTGQDDILIGTPSPSGRKRSEVQKLLGHFLNPVVLRFDLSDDPVPAELLRRTQRLTLDALSNDDVPLETVAHEIYGTAEIGSYPFFRAAISLQPPAPRLDLDWSVTSMDVASGGAPWDFYIAFISRPTGLIGRIQYNPDLMDGQAIRRLLHDFQAVLEFMSANPLKRLSQMSLPAPVHQTNACTQEQQSI